MVYAGSWTHAAQESFTSSDYQDTESYSGTAGDSATVAFTGTAIRWIGSQTGNHGFADVYLDGVPQATVDTSGNATQKVLFQRSGLASGPHALEIVVDGRHSSGWTANFVSIDAIDTHVPGLVSDAEVQQRATQILSSLKANLNINTVRLGVNEQTTQDAWWTNYGAVVQAATGLGMNVLIGFWSPSNSSPGSVVPCTDGVQ